jgi:hypothetical protein
LNLLPRISPTRSTRHPPRESVRFGCHQAPSRPGDSRRRGIDVPAIGL